MANSTVIREFLVALGFKVDEKGLKNLQTGVEDATKGVTRLVGAISGAALAVGAGVSAFASKLEGLYFASQRVGASANNLRSLEGAAKDFGVSSEAALSTVENLARFLRNVPGSEGLLAQMGVEARDSNGRLRDSVDILADLGKKLSELPQYEANAYGGVFGIDENLLLAMRDPAFLARMQQIRVAAENNGMDQASRDAHEWMNQLRSLGRSLENLSTKVEGVLLRRLGPQLERFKKWFDEKGPEIAERIGDIAEAIVKAAATFGPPLAWIVDQFLALDKATDGWSTKIGLALGLFTAFGGASLISGIWKMVAALRAMSLATAAVGTSATAAGAAGAGAGAAGAAGGAAAGWLSRLLPWLSRAAGAAGLLLYSGGLNNGEEAELARRRALGATESGTGAQLPRGIRNNNPGNLNFARQEGATRESGPNGRFAVFATAQQGLEALAIQLKRYANAGLNTIRAIIAKYAPVGENNTEAYIASVAKKFGVSDTTRLDLSNKDTLANMMSAVTQFENGQNPYTRDMIVAAAAKGVDHTGKFGGGQVKIEQKTEINVHGVSDPNAAARAVFDQQSRVSDELVRNLQGSVQ